MTQLQDILPHVTLRFNIENADLEDCWVEGYQCASAEIDEEQNPFEADTAEYQQWNQGWWAGFYGEEPIYAVSTDTSFEELPVDAANEESWQKIQTKSWLGKVVKITGAIAATAVIGYQLVDMVA